MATVNYIYDELTPILYLVLLMVIFSVPAMLTTGIIYSRGYRRTFFIGAMFPGGGAILLYYGMLGMLGNLEYISVIITTVVCWLLLIIVSGTAAIIMRWLVEPKTEAE